MSASATSAPVSKLDMDAAAIANKIKIGEITSYIANSVPLHVFSV
ncbi:hypothetical protein J2Z81_000207 [Virgibacillus campisalis]|uniref:Uncharacterized protein n=1 Tax=Virgibacillus alimentarius TaxID=698769 RepID=A0ABS4S466_9BACI|nr:hypothetical protein [Virgibacillus alimentarius]